MPVYQTIFTAPGGNCLQACIASIFDLPLAEVPHFNADANSRNSKWTQEQWDAVCRFAAEHGKSATWIDPDEQNASELLPLLHGSELYYVASGPAITGQGGWSHCVVWHKGKHAHDPTPGNGGLAGPPELYILFQ
jgi:hypothetical protein